jgi:hypothetical protein
MAEGAKAPEGCITRSIIQVGLAADLYELFPARSRHANPARDIERHKSGLAPLGIKGLERDT